MHHCRCAVALLCAGSLPAVQDYFRPITQEDLLALLPVALSAEEDEALTVPFLGRDTRSLDVKQHPGAAKAGGKAALRDDNNDADAFEVG